MPIHPVIGHLVAVLAPLAALMALAYACVPRARRGLRLPTVTAVVLASAGTLWAGSTGLTLYRRFAVSGLLAAPTTAHAHGSDLLTLAAGCLMIAVLATGWLWLRPGRRGGVGPLIAASVVTVSALSTLAATWIVVAAAVGAVWAHHVPY